MPRVLGDTSLTLWGGCCDGREGGTRASMVRCVVHAWSLVVPFKKGTRTARILSCVVEDSRCEQPKMLYLYMWFIRKAYLSYCSIPGYQQCQRASENTERTVGVEPIVRVRRPEWTSLSVRQT